MAARVEIQSVELLNAFFANSDSEPLPTPITTHENPELTVGVEWKLSDEQDTLGCVLSFSTHFPEDHEPYRVMGRFRVLYALRPGEPLDGRDLDNFAHWNAVFNAWPYWREFLASTLGRTLLPPFVVPVLGVPRAPDSPNAASS